ncbi:hypothetical protein [Neisseria meningitidis]|nr:hypothetical protein [Neisseria meningitidis]CKL03491.1 Uncharacterised protein [Neisseria meningitidis]
MKPGFFGHIFLTVLSIAYPALQIVKAQISGKHENRSDGISLSLVV